MCVCPCAGACACESPATRASARIQCFQLFPVRMSRSLRPISCNTVSVAHPGQWVANQYTISNIVYIKNYIQKAIKQAEGDKTSVGRAFKCRFPDDPHCEPATGHASHRCGC